MCLPDDEFVRFPVANRRRSLAVSSGWKKSDRPSALLIRLAAATRKKSRSAGLSGKVKIEVYGYAPVEWHAARSGTTLGIYLEATLGGAEARLN
jgi:hypothetical protein